MHAWLIALLAGAVLAAPPAHAQTEPAPKIGCAEPVFNFGTMDNSQNVEHTFVLRNEGNLTLEIAQVRPSCGCTVASISERSVPPSGESRVTTRLSLHGRSGPQHKTIIVESNDPTQPQYTLTLTGTAGVTLDVQPPRVLLGQVAAGSKPRASVQLAGMPGTPYRITAVEVNNPQLAADVTTVEDGRVYTLNLAAREPLPPGQFEAMVQLKTDHPQRPVVEIPVTFLVVGELVVAPQVIEFPQAGTEPASRSVVVRSSTGTSLTIVGVEPPDPSIVVQVEPFGPGGYMVKLSNIVPTLELDGKVVTIRVQAPDAREITVPFRVPAPPAS